jgi:1-acyl-sn-glycerol-3-phosphate acyltransferase
MPRRDRPSLFYRLVVLTAKPVMYGLYRLKVDGLENIPATGGFVLSANHVSSFDPWPLGVAIGDRHYLRHMAKSELYWRPLKWVVDAGGGFPVRRGERDTKAMETAVELARKGDAVVMFPEGTRRKKGLRKTREARAHTGAARIALEAGVPLVPAAIAGTDRLARLGKVRVRYGPPIEVDDLAGLDEHEAAQIATDRLMAAIHDLEADL